MIKKLILPTAVIGATLFLGNSAHEAKADEVNHAKLVDLANNNQEELNSKPVQAGAYNIDFVDNGQSYHFESNGSTWSWSVGGEATSNTTEAVKAPEQKVDQQQVQFNTQNKQDTKEYVQPTSVSAPVQKETKQPTQTTSKSTGGSVAEQIRQAGGDEAMIEIAMRESTMNPNAVNASSGAQGLFQGLGKSWSGGSIAEQTKGAKQYMIDRYGSTSGALAYHNAHNSY